jgi:hypothetical protein
VNETTGPGRLVEQGADLAGGSSTSFVGALETIMGETAEQIVSFPRHAANGPISD